MPLYLIIPIWKPVDIKWDSCKAQNLFGAKIDIPYSTEVTFYKKEEALQAIEEHKKNIKFKRDRFFKRPKKEIKKTTYI